MTATTFMWPAWDNGPRTAKHELVLRHFVAWIDRHAEAYAAFAARSRALLAGGERRLSAHRVWEHVRAQRFSGNAGGRVKLRSDLTRPMAMLAMHREPDLKGCFRTRPSATKGQVSGASLTVDQLPIDSQIAWHEGEPLRLREGDAGRRTRGGA